MMPKVKIVLVDCSDDDYYSQEIITAGLESQDKKAAAKKQADKERAKFLELQAKFGSQTKGR